MSSLDNGKLTVVLYGERTKARRHEGGHGMFIEHLKECGGLGLPLPDGRGTVTTAKLPLVSATRPLLVH